MTVLLDTGVVFAFLHANDARHGEAVDLISRTAQKEFGQPFVTDHVIDELFLLARVRTRSAALEESLRRFLPMPSPALRGLAAVSLGTSFLQPTWEVFRQYRDLGLSFTDASLIVTLREMKFDQLATFDDRLGHIVRRAD
jgi:predicted nucleic acid-binding protein